MTQAYFELAPNGLIIETDSPEVWANDANATRLTAAEGKRRHKAYAKAQLLKMVKPGDVVFTVLRHVSKSGMRRRIDLFKLKNNEKEYLSGYAAAVIGYPLSRDGGIVIDGCGSDMGFELVYALGCALWPSGTKRPHGTRNGEPDTAGGYALKHRWL